MGRVVHIQDHSIFSVSVCKANSAIYGGDFRLYAKNWTEAIQQLQLVLILVGSKPETQRGKTSYSVLIARDLMPFQKYVRLDIA